MSQQNKAEVTDNFTEDIEATIDDLFAPVKEIEIDPLTNEIKEKNLNTEETAKPDSVTDDSSNIDQDAGASQETLVNPEDEEGFATEDSENFLDIELELDLEPPSDENIETVSTGNDKEEASNPDSESALEEFSQTIMSLEWEIKTDTIQAASSQAGALKEALQGRTGSSVIELLDLISVLLSAMQDKPDLMPSVPTALKRAAETLKESFQSPDADILGASIDELETLVKEEAALQAEGAEEPATPEDKTPDDKRAEGAAIQEESGENISPEEMELQVESEPDGDITGPEGDMEELSLEPEPESPTTEMTEAVMDGNSADEEEEKQETDDTTLAENPGSPEPEHEAAPSASFTPQGTVSEVFPDGISSHQKTTAEGKTGTDRYEILSRTLALHLAEMERLNDRIVPVEKLLAKTPGMEKLHAFQKGIRETIRQQIAVLENVLDGRSATAREIDRDEKISEEPLPADVEKSLPSNDKCPWNELQCLDFNGRRIAFAAEEIAFAGNVPGRFRKKLHKESEFAVSWLKPWPWVKIRPSVSGSLAHKDEKVLKEMKLPLLNTEFSEILGVEDSTRDLKNPVAVILYMENGEKGVLYVENAPETLTLDSAHEWKPSPSRGEIPAGELRIGDDTFTVMSKCPEA